MTTTDDSWVLAQPDEYNLIIEWGAVPVELVTEDGAQHTPAVKVFIKRLVSVPHGAQSLGDIECDVCQFTLCMPDVEDFVRVVANAKERYDNQPT